jgi:type VI secretion system protein ImpH
MGSETRQSNSGLIKALQDKPHAFSFFQVIQLLQRYLGVGVGGGSSASDERLRLKPAVSMSFPAADLLAIEAEGEESPTGQRFRITTSFLGLYSSDSPLPTFCTEDLFWKENDQKAVRDFVDIFHHRALSLFYRAWEKYRHTVQFRHQGSDEYSRRVYSLIGLGTRQLIESTGLPSVRLLHYVGLITRKPHSASVLSGTRRCLSTKPAGNEKLRTRSRSNRWSASAGLRRQVSGCDRTAGPEGLFALSSRLQGLRSLDQSDSLLYYRPTGFRCRSKTAR